MYVYRCYVYIYIYIERERESSVIEHIQIKVWFDTWSKKLLSFIQSCCLDLTIYTDFFTLKKFKVELSLSKKFILFASRKPIKNDEKCFLFHLESVSLFFDFVLIFWSCRKISLNREIRLFSKFMAFVPV